VHEIGRLLPADTALEMSVEYASVIVFGRGSLIAEAPEAERALQLLLHKYFSHLQPSRDYRPITPEELARTSVYRIEIEEWSAKRKQVDPDFPGAFFFEPQRESKGICSGLHYPTSSGRARRRPWTGAPRDR
jgi:hypothetical protein